MSPSQSFTTAIFPGSTAGHVTLQGGGDPLLSKKNLKTLATQLAAIVDHTQPLVIDTDLNPHTDPVGQKATYPLLCHQ